MELTLDMVVSDIVEHLKKSKEKFILIEDFPKVLTSIIEKKYGNFEYTNEVGIAIKKSLVDSGKVDVFKEGYDYFDSDNRSVYSAGNYYALKGFYKDVIDMKDRHGIVPYFSKSKEYASAWANGTLADEEYTLK